MDGLSGGLGERGATPGRIRSDGSGRIVVMPARISCVCIDAVEPRPVADFWAAVLGWDVVEDGDEGISLASPSRDLPTLDILPVPEAKQMKNRLHLDLRADGTSFDAELNRLESLGARRVDVGQSPDVTWVVFADPEGNEFCLLRRTVQEVTADPS
jgi:predicted enzyme related to lactoylglutathione lyase